jgi:hypothetical protein
VWKIVTFNPLAPVPATSISNVISASSDTLVGLLVSVAAVAAVVDVSSSASMVNKLVKILEPATFISTVGSPEVDAVLSEALGIDVILNA